MDGDRGFRIQQKIETVKWSGKHLKSEPIFQGLWKREKIHEIEADFHPIALVRRMKPLCGFVFFSPILKISYQNRITNLVIIDADIMGAISIGSNSKFTIKEVFL